jgi:hypothetical protein
MATRFLAELFTLEVLEARARYMQRAPANVSGDAADRLGPDEVGFISERDSFYMATVSSSGWPYVQRCGGPP